jgi:predicted Fe-Mo cluster-binding NifX family protein
MADEKGPSAAETLAAMDVGTVIVGTVGPRAFRILDEAGVSVKAGCSGKVSTVIKRCAAGKLKECKGATFKGHLGI